MTGVRTQKCSTLPTTFYSTAPVCAATLTQVYTSDHPGNGKTHCIRKDILEAERTRLCFVGSSAKNLSEFQLHSNPNLDTILDQSRDDSSEPDLDSVTEHVLIAGEISQTMLKARLVKLKTSKKDLRHLVVKIDYMENLLDRAYMVNDLLFQLCHFKCFFLDDEPVFLAEGLEVRVEVQNYLNQFLFRNIQFLSLLPRRQLAFDLNLLEFPINTVEHPIQTTCFFIDRVILQRQTGHFDLYPVDNPLNHFQRTAREGLPVEPLPREHALRLLQSHYVDNPNRQSELTFANVMLFCQMAAYEFRNLNHICLLDYKELDANNHGLDMSQKKPQLFYSALQICVRSTNQSIKAISTQEHTFEKLNVSNIGQRWAHWRN